MSRLFKNLELMKIFTHFSYHRYNFGRLEVINYGISNQSNQRRSAGSYSLQPESEPGSQAP